MATPAHKNNTKHFDELTFAEQAKSITAMINNLSNGIESHVRDSADPEATRKKCILQVHRFLGRLLDK